MGNSEKIQQAGENQLNEGSGGIGKRVVETMNAEHDEQSIRAEFESQYEDSKKIRNAFSRIRPGSSDFLLGMPNADFNEEGFSGDAASLYMLVKFQKEDGPKTELVKIGWGEFSKQTFTKGAQSKYSNYVPEYNDGKYYGYVAEHEVLRSLPFDVYCVNQYESYFADEELQKDMCFNPEKYLREHALFVTKDGNVTMASRRDAKLPMGSRNRNLEYPITPITEEEALEGIDMLKNLYREKIEELSK